MKAVFGVQYLDQRVICDDIAFACCRFDGCILVKTKRSSGAFEHCVSAGCKLEGDGWSPEARKLNAAHLKQRITPQLEPEVCEAVARPRSKLQNRMKEADKWASRGKSA